MIPMIVFVLCLFVDLYIFVFVAWTGLCPPQLSSAAKVRGKKPKKAATRSIHKKNFDQIHSLRKNYDEIPFIHKILQ